jgi:predicted metal-dependent phosphoesterase TrpH
MTKLKIDLHMHAGEDPQDGIPYPATALIDRAVALGFGAIAITLHGKVLDDQRVFHYAAERGLLLIPAAEARIKGRDVLMYNVSQTEIDRLRSFDDLRAFRQERGNSLLVVAPHPCFVVGHSLQSYFEPNIDLFDAVEYSQMHLRWLNYNRPAERIAKRHGKPVIANSDAHALWMFGRHYTLVESEPTMEGIFDGIRQGRIETVSPPITTWEAVKFVVIDAILERRRGRTLTSFPETNPHPGIAGTSTSPRRGAVSTTAAQGGSGTSCSRFRCSHAAASACGGDEAGDPG